MIHEPDRSYIITIGPSENVPYHIYLKRNEPNNCVKKIAVYFVNECYRLDGNSEIFKSFEELMFRFRHRFVHKVENDFDIELFPYYVGAMEFNAVKRYLEETGRTFALRWSEKTNGFRLAVNNDQYRIKIKDGKFTIRSITADTCGEAIRNFLTSIDVDYYQN